MIKGRLEWGPLRKKLARLTSTELRTAQETAVEKTVETMEETWTERIINNGYGVPGNAPSVIRRKGRDQPLVDTEGYAHAMTGGVETSSQHVVLVMGLAGDSPSDIPYSTLGEVLDQGTSTYPPRPHLAKFEAEVADELLGNLMKEVDDVLGE